MTRIMTHNVIVLCALVAVIHARPQGRLLDAINPLPYITRSENNNVGSNSYVFNVDTSDGFHHGQLSEPKKVGDEESAVVYGTYSYTGDDGKQYYVEYRADENGFMAAGEHIPKSAGTARVGSLGIPSAAIASLAGGGIG